VSKPFFFNQLLKKISGILSEENEGIEKTSPQQKAHQREIENSILVLVADVIRCHGKYSTNTEEFIRQFISKQFGSKGINQRLIFINNHIETGTEPYTKIACKELVILTTLESRLVLLQFLFGVAVANDFITEKEVRCLKRISSYLKITEVQFQKLESEFLSKNNPYALLEIENNSTPTQVKTAYRKMVLKFHPDKRAKGISEHDAAKKFQAIKHAFEIIIEQQKK
jgi:DnaJ like chaperone protein